MTGSWSQKTIFWITEVRLPAWRKLVTTRHFPTNLFLHRSATFRLRSSRPNWRKVSSICFRKNCGFSFWRTRVIKAWLEWTQWTRWTLWTCQTRPRLSVYAVHSCLLCPSCPLCPLTPGPLSPLFVKRQTVADRPSSIFDSKPTRFFLQKHPISTVKTDPVIERPDLRTFIARARYAYFCLTRSISLRYQFETKRNARLVSRARCAVPALTARE